MQTASDLPPELREQLSGQKEKNDIHSMCLGYMDERGPATVDELIVYLHSVRGEVTSRDYMYHVLSRLRRRGHIERLELETERMLRHMLTTDGEAYIKARGIRYVSPHKETEDE